MEATKELEQLNRTRAQYFIHGRQSVDADEYLNAREVLQEWISDILDKGFCIRITMPGGASYLINQKGWPIERAIPSTGYCTFTATNGIRGGCEIANALRIESVERG